MRQVRNTAVCILAVIVMAPGLTCAAQDNYEIDLKELGPAKPKAKLQPAPQPSSPASVEIDLKELRKIAPPQAVKPTQHKRRSQTAAAPEAATAASGQESIHVVQPGEHLYQILMKQYGLSDPTAERLVPEVMRLNGITSAKGLQVGQRLRIPLPAREGKQSVSASVAVKKSRRPAPVAAAQPAASAPAAIPETTVQTAAAAPAQTTSPAPTTKPAEPPALAGSISIVSASPCKLAHDMAEKMGLLAASPTGIVGVETVGAVYAGRSVTAVCGLSKAELYTFERLLASNGKQLLVFEEDEAEESVVEELADSLGLEFHKRDAEAEELPLTYVFAPFGSWSQEVQLTILPAQADSDPPAASKPEK